MIVFLTLGSCYDVHNGIKFLILVDNSMMLVAVMIIVIITNIVIVVIIINYGSIIINVVAVVAITPCGTMRDTYSTLSGLISTPLKAA